ncbi:heat shock protein 70Cb isoform X2 [Arctopsyche grandis]|uniref:heat shock protein 70Cb isoform X2 n=1 Tax=Arctopsyche grandis TaxID=121162 RepID=UPI00406D8ED0
MAAMSVIGLEFGTDSCYVAVAKAGGIETIANDYSLRATPSCVAFSPTNRILGVAAFNQMVTNMKNTVTSFKRLLGRKYNDPYVQQELRHLPFRVEERPDGGVGVRVHYLNEDHVFSPEQLTAMLFTKLKETSAAALQTPVYDCVISVPSYYTNTERKALLDAANISGLNVLRLMNETTATALAYGIYKQDLPPASDKPRHVVFVDMGHASLQASICAFHHGALKVLATSSDANLGGRDINFVLAQHFCQDFQARYKIDVRSNSKSFLRLLQEVEKIKKQMSANSTKLPLNIECLIDEKDVTGEMQRNTMESLCTDLFQRVERTLRHCLHQSKLRLDDIYSVEIVGGSSRVPAVKAIIEKVFGKAPSTSLNQDEAVARGAALQCAILSPAVRVRDFSVTDVQPYAIRLCWDADMGDDGEMEVFSTNHAAPFSKLLTFYRKEPFTLSAYYAEPVPYPQSFIGKWVINDIKPTAEGESQKIKIKIRVNIHGIITVASATLVEKKDAADNDKDAESQENANAENNQDQPMENSTEQQNGMDDAANEVSNPATPEQQQSWTQRVGQWFSSDKGKNKKQSIKVELTVKAQSCGYTAQELNELLERELTMETGDRKEKERADSRNALEEYVYELRNAISDDGHLHRYTSPSEKTGFLRLLDDTENWLYEDGENCDKQVYNDKLNELRNLGDPIKTRCMEYESEPEARDDFVRAVLTTKEIVDLYKKADAKYSHFEEADVNKVIEAVEKAEKWIAHVHDKVRETPKCQSPPFTVQQIRQEKQNFFNTVSPIVNKPKPKEKTPPPTGNGPTTQESNPQQTNPEQPQQPSDQMDVE